MQGSHARIKVARRHLKLSQSALAKAVGVQRSAVSHWESALGKNPTVANLRRIAEITDVQFEWLATGRGAMALSSTTKMESISAAAALLVEDALEMRMVRAMRGASLQAKVSLVEIAEQLSVQRSGRGTKASSYF